MKVGRILLMANIILSGLVLYASAEIVRSWSSRTQKTPHMSAGKQAISAEKPNSPLKDKSPDFYRKIFRKNIFHRGKPGTSSSRVPRDPVAITKLNLELRGTVIGQGEASYAVIYDGRTRREEYYGVHDFVQGARIVQIRSDQVVLFSNGKHEALVMSYEQKSSARRSRVKKRRPVRRVKKVVRKRPPVRTDD
jgi:type II secretory pathway component PulC